ncbi:MAG: Gfo/Idh/MocA family oxidoreductase [Clostridia bacterium]|nr:Gfo/Idh/MocA family oxidoreductase [Clostridia bacterium]
MKWCVIGAGGIADRRTIPAIIKDEKNTLVAVMDKNGDVAKATGEKYGVAYFNDEEEMLKAVSCDAVYIATPVMCHYEQSMIALKYGKHVFLEKPVCANAIDSRKLVDAFKKANKQINIGYMMKFHNLHVKAKELIKNDEIGEVNTVRLQFTCWYPDIKGAWRQIKALGGGGAIMDLGVHCIELIEYILDDEIESVKSFYSTKTFSYEVEDGAIIIFRTKGGVLGHIDVNFNIPDDASESKLELYGTKGYIQCNGTLAQEEVGKLSHLYAPQGDYSAAQNRTSGIATIYEGEKGNLYEKQIKSFRETVESGVLDYYYADRAVQVQEIVDRIYNEN